MGINNEKSVPTVSFGEAKIQPKKIKWEWEKKKFCKKLRSVQCKSFL